VNIVIASQFFYPEIGAPAARFLDFGRYFTARGHRVTVLTGMPNFPSGRIDEKYRAKMFVREVVEGVDVVRSWLFASPRATVATKAAGYATFAASSTLSGILARLPADVVIATAPPPTIGAVGLALSRAYRVPLVYDLRDLWPEAVVQSGRLRPGLGVRALEALNHRVYASASAVTTVSEGKRDRLIEQGVPPDKVHVIPNGVDIRYFDAAAAEQRPAASALLASAGVAPEHFVALYAGIMNPPQGLPSVLDAAEALQAQGRADKLRIVLVGGGSERPKLERAVADRGLWCVRFLPEQPRAIVYALLTLAHATLVPLRPRKDLHTVPSKLFECLASARPVILAADGEPSRIVRDAGAGAAVAAGSGEGIASALQSLMEAPERGHDAGRRGRAYVEARYDRFELNRRFLELLTSLTHGGGAGG
jgi:glycosyltransferase involved in cell wall biosynthesis